MAVFFENTEPAAAAETQFDNKNESAPGLWGGEMFADQNAPPTDENQKSSPLITPNAERCVTPEIEVAYGEGGSKLEHREPGSGKAKDGRWEALSGPSSPQRQNGKRDAMSPISPSRNIWKWDQPNSGSNSSPDEAEKQPGGAPKNAWTSTRSPRFGSQNEDPNLPPHRSRGNGSPGRSNGNKRYGSGTPSPNHMKDRLMDPLDMSPLDDMNRGGYRQPFDRRMDFGYDEFEMDMEPRRHMGYHRPPRNGYAPPPRGRYPPDNRRMMDRDFNNMFRDMDMRDRADRYGYGGPPMSDRYGHVDDYYHGPRGHPFESDMGYDYDDPYHYNPRSYGGPRSYGRPGRREFERDEMAYQMQREREPMDMRELADITGVNKDGQPAICRFFLAGHCAKGSDCNYAHLLQTKGSGMIGAKTNAFKKPGLGMRDKMTKGKPGDAYENLASVYPDMFPSGTTPTLTPQTLKGRIYTLAKDQHGCRVLQRILDEKDPKMYNLIFDEVYDRINELMTDPFANYLCQKLMEYASESNRVRVLRKVSSDLVAISLNIHGTRVIQKILEHISGQEEISIVVEALSKSVVTLTKDLNGNHVIQRCLHHMPPPTSTATAEKADNQFIYDSIATNIVSVATHKHGCCVVQRCMDYATPRQKTLLTKAVIAVALELVQDAFGNYVVQYIMDPSNGRIVAKVTDKLEGSIGNLAVQKFSSNVIEKCLELGDEKVREKLIAQLIDTNRLPRLIQDPYANYVIQKALEVSKKEKFQQMVKVIRPHVRALRATSFGKRIQAKMVKKFPTLLMNND